MKNRRRKTVWAALAVGAALAFAAGCVPGEENARPLPSTGEQGAAESRPAGEAEERLSLTIVDGAQTGELVLAGEGAGEVYTLTLGDAPVYLDGQPAEASLLEDGMTAEIAFSGGITETWPAGLEEVSAVSVYSRGTAQNPGGGFYDLCGFYLAVMEDLWNTDEGLNSGTEYISVDLSQAPGGLTKGEKAAVAWVFAGVHGAKPLALSRQELTDQGYCEPYEWRDGILFSISDGSGEGEACSLPTLRFHAEKWRSGTGAYVFYGCSAVWPELGTWSGYSVESHMIS